MLYDVHVSNASTWDPFISVTSEAPEVVIFDLTPSTSYRVAVRARGPLPDRWSSLGPATDCSTADDAGKSGPGSAVVDWGTLLLSQRTPGSTSQFTLELSHTSPSDARYDETWLVYTRKRGATEWDSYREFPPSSTMMSLQGLDAGSEYEVFVTTNAPPHPQTPIVLYRTRRQRGGDAKSAFFEVFRISELCGDDCQPDMLEEHDSGDLLSDVSFITHVASSSHGHFNISFNASIVTRYCVERSVPPARDWADYLSCNGPWTTDYLCECNNWIDRCIGRLDISVCDLGNTSARMPPCHCTDASLARSAAEVGRMPVYHPFPAFTKDKNCTATMPGVNASTLLGYWYSTPKDAACSPGVSPSGKPGACSWSRRQDQHFVLGADLKALGFNTSGAADLAELRQNRDVLKAAFARHPARCCGC